MRIRDVVIVTAAALLALASAPAGAQRPFADTLPLLHEPVARLPFITRVEVRGDSVWFLPPGNGEPGEAFLLARGSGRWARVRRVVPWPTSPRLSQGGQPDSVPLARGFTLVRVPYAPDSTFTHAIRGPDGTLYPLLAPRVAAQVAWRRRHPPAHLDAAAMEDRVAEHRRVMAAEEEDTLSGQPRRTWAPVRVERVLVDGNSVWLGLMGTDEPDDDYAAYDYGGLMRFDLATREVETVVHDDLMRATVGTMAVAGGSLWIAAHDTARPAALLRYDVRRRAWSPAPEARVGGVTDIAGVDDELFIAGMDGLARLRVGSGALERRHFRLALAAGGAAGDSIVHELAEAAHPLDWDELAIYTAIGNFRIRRGIEFRRLASGKVHARGARYGEEGVRNPEMSVDFRDTTEDRPGDDEVEATLRSLRVEGLDAPALAPFYAEAIGRVHGVERAQLATLLGAIGDRRWAPAVRAALATLDTSDAPWSAGQVALALHRLHDPSGTAWMRAVLADATHHSGWLSTDFFAAAGATRDTGVTRLLLAAAAGGSLGEDPARTLLASDDASVVARLAALGARMTGRARQAFVSALFYRVHDGSWTPVRAERPPYGQPAVRSALAAAVRPAVADTSAWTATAATRLLGDFGDLRDVPTLAARLTSDAEAYDAALAALVRVTGQGSSFPPARRTSAPERLAVRRWFDRWFARDGAGYRPPPLADRDSLYAGWERRRLMPTVP